uniref:Uncharacterized protein n=1 Tax=Knipowitschia caucasica TaxID=637954 RepID=A0AAV2IUX1_KNICA
MTMRESIIQCHATVTLALMPRHSRRGLRSRYFMRKISLQVYSQRQNLKKTVHQMMSARKKCCLGRSLNRHLLQTKAGGRDVTTENQGYLPMTDSVHQLVTIL